MFEQVDELEGLHSLRVMTFYELALDSTRRYAMKHCLDCGVLSAGSRCPVHARARHTRMYGGRWQRLSRHMRANVRRCERCGAVDDLTTDHVVPDSLAGGVQVLCRSCNAKKSGILGG